MPATSTTRKLEAYQLSIHEDGKALADYPALFRRLSETPPENRIYESTERVVALKEVGVKGQRVSFLAVEGPPGVQPYIFDTSDAEIRLQRLKAGEIVATVTHAVLDLRSHRIVVEYNQRGAKVNDIALVVQNTVERTEQRSLVVEFSPVVTEEFITAINRFKRIQLATLTVVRPNPDWTDHVNNLTAIGQESEGHRIAIEVGASRSHGLSSNKGIIGYIKAMVSSKFPTLKNATVTGTRDDEGDSNSVSLHHHIKSKRVNVRLGPGRQVDDADVERKINDFLSEILR